MCHIQLDGMKLAWVLLKCSKIIEIIFEAYCFRAAKSQIISWFFFVMKEITNVQWLWYNRYMGFEPLHGLLKRYRSFFKQSSTTINHHHHHHQRILAGNIGLFTAPLSLSSTVWSKRWDQSWGSLAFTLPCNNNKWINLVFLGNEIYRWCIGIR